MKNPCGKEETMKVINNKDKDACKVCTHPVKGATMWCHLCTKYPKTKHWKTLSDQEKSDWQIEIEIEKQAAAFESQW